VVVGLWAALDGVSQILRFADPKPLSNDSSDRANGKAESMKRQTMNTSIATALAGLLLSGCTIKRACSQIPVPPQFTQRESWKTELAGGATPKPAEDAALSQWWTAFGDPILSSLEERALKANLDIRTSEAEIRQSRASRLSASGPLIPSVSLTGSGTGIRTATNSGTSFSQGGQYSQNYSAEFSASWEPDFFGALHKNVAAYDADIQVAQENLRTVMVSLTADLALDYVELRSDQAQLKVTKENLVEYKETYEMTLEKKQSGLASDLDVEQALENVQSTEATIPSLETDMRQMANAIAVLLGEQPGAVDSELATEAPIPVIPPEVPVGIPTDLLRRRPDVRSAERQVAAQALFVGVAKANLYPTFILSGTFQFSASKILDVFTPAALASTVIGSVEQAILNRRQLKAQVKLQNAILDQDEVAYESTLLGAVRDVENDLQAFGAEQVRRKSLAEAAVSAENAAEISRELYGSGLKDFLTVLYSERVLLSVQYSLVQSDAAVASDLIQLYKAMGGGWR
jgi:NodT family efflux transporter outer membrane factor (OMF) lipoprotein